MAVLMGKSKPALPKNNANSADKKAEGRDMRGLRLLLLRRGARESGRRRTLAASLSISLYIRGWCWSSCRI